MLPINEIELNLLTRIDGTVPERLLYETLNVSRWGKFTKEVGISIDRLLRERSRKVRVVMLPMVPGICPLNLLLLKFRTDRFLKFLTDSGIWLYKLLFPDFWLPEKRDW